MAIEGIKGFFKLGEGGVLLVGARAVKRPNRLDYEGPVAEVSWKDDWLHISTDYYEGSAMLNIEALPFLIKALRIIQRDFKAKSTTPIAQKEKAL